MNFDLFLGIKLTNLKTRNLLVKKKSKKLRVHKKIALRLTSAFQKVPLHSAGANHSVTKHVSKVVASTAVLGVEDFSFPLSGKSHEACVSSS